MKLRLNGREEHFPQLAEGSSLERVLAAFRLKNCQISLAIPQDPLTQFAVAVNQSFVAKTKYGDCKIYSSDEIEIVQPHPGG